MDSHIPHWFSIRIPMQIDYANRDVAYISALQIPYRDCLLDPAEIAYRDNLLIPKRQLIDTLELAFEDSKIYPPEIVIETVYGSQYGFPIGSLQRLYTFPPLLQLIGPQRDTIYICIYIHMRCRSSQRLHCRSLKRQPIKITFRPPSDFSIDPFQRQPMDPSQNPYRDRRCRSSTDPLQGFPYRAIRNSLQRQLIWKPYRSPQIPYTDSLQIPS